MENKKETYNIWGYEDFMDDQKKPFIARVIIGNQICEKKIYGFKRVIKDYIKEELDCKSQKQIARELGLSKNYMRKLLRELNCEEA